MSASRERVAAAVGPVTFAAFRALARWRGAPAFHPVGSVFTGLAEIDRSAPAGFPTGSFPCVVRVSRGVGLPAPAPDLMGIGVRLVDALGPEAHQDLLTTTSGSSVLGRRLPRPTRAIGRGMSGTILAYATAEGVVLFGIRLLGPGRLTVPGPGADRARGPGGLEARIDLELLTAGRTGPWRPIGTLRLDRQLDASAERDLDLDPFHTAGAVRPVGWVNGLRRPAYVGSRRGRRPARRR